MCGLLGILGIEGISRSTFENSLRLLDHRGPDDTGLYEIRSNTAGWFGHTRLSIQDLSPAGHQPMVLENRWVIVFNGEIYNFRELGAELAELGVRFKSSSDTEVILHAYKTWGPGALERFNGMFSLAIFDLHEEQLFLARDRIGIKPLYYWHENSFFVFSSELKAICALPAFPKRISSEGFVQYLQWQFVPAPGTIFENTFKLPQGHYAILKANQLEVQQWWSPYQAYTQPKQNSSYEELLHEGEALLKSSIQYRMIADVPVGCFLSGGIDSTLVAATMSEIASRPIKTFSIGMQDKELNEAEYAKDIASYLGTDHHEHYIETQELTGLIPQLSQFWDEPFSDSSAIPTMLVSKLARSEVTVALSGDGGDELFCGYYRYRWMEQLNVIGRLPILRGVFSKIFSSQVFEVLGIGPHRRLKKVGAALSWERIEDQYRSLSNIWYKGQLESLLSSFKPVSNPCREVFQQSGSLVEKLMLADLVYYLVEDILVKVDRASMSTSLEARVPLLDHRFVEFALKVPMKFKRSGSGTKVLLREILSKKVPQNLWDRPKAGFEIPIKNWLMNELYDWMMDLFSKNSCEKHGLFEYAQVHRLIEEHKLGKYDYGYQLWTLAMFQDWYLRYFH